MVSEKIFDVVEMIKKEGFEPVYMKEKEYIIAYDETKNDFIIVDVCLTLENQNIYISSVFKDNEIHLIDIMYDLVFFDGEIIYYSLFYAFLKKLFKELDLIYSIERKNNIIKKEIIYFDNCNGCIEQKIYVNEGGFEYGSWLACYLEEVFAFIPPKDIKKIKSDEGSIDVYSLKDLPF